jgi:hypothetical protein
MGTMLRSNRAVAITHRAILRVETAREIAETAGLRDSPRHDQREAAPGGRQADVEAIHSARNHREEKPGFSTNPGF